MCKRLTRFCSKSYDEMIFRMKTDTLRDVQLFGIWQKMPFFHCDNFVDLFKNSTYLID